MGSVGMSRPWAQPLVGQSSLDVPVGGLHIPQSAGSLRVRSCPRVPTSCTPGSDSLTWASLQGQPPLESFGSVSGVTAASAFGLLLRTLAALSHQLIDDPRGVHCLVRLTALAAPEEVLVLGQQMLQEVRHGGRLWRRGRRGLSLCVG